MKYMAPENKWQRQKKLPARNEENGTSRLLRTAPPKNQVAEKKLRSIRSRSEGNAYAIVSVGEGELG